MKELVVVGCGTVVPEADRGSACFYLDTGTSRILMDCGPGSVQALARLDIPWEALTDVAITHFHADHIGALPGLFFAFTHGLESPREAPIDVWGPPGTIRLFEGLAGALGRFMLDPGFEIRLHEILPGDVVRLGGGAMLGAHSTPHTDESLAYRIDEGGAAVGYTGDSGPTETLGPFMHDVDVLVSECSFLDREAADTHLSPSHVAAIALAADPGELVLSHIYPHVRASADVAELVRAAGFGGPVRLAFEGLRISFCDPLRRPLPPRGR